MAKIEHAAIEIDADDSNIEELKEDLKVIKEEIKAQELSSMEDNLISTGDGADTHLSDEFIRQA